ncbi:4-deoxy-4-formamido-L-arabinose-phosphoundecaprenol deformylase [Ereboglobus luteus]|uniref:4-deoxy-4-formamido-L-arabinose-phosphoundecaprenol deformylase n=1 Tax=Ereboglobus luteus TaxID=1796921 RepID=A0A2U8E209_9BACT|nr:4-deoxy-4-formamido-L-arabinose-phosphoundecaprenol deformylase [Ereboglobus luteus]AWI08840.1 4-deoxy-4-formamido-L-arabinose-phosphoundecaprenol deformylase [Ereboglobus luteus]
MPKLALKIDVDTERGTRVGVPALVALLREFEASACFLFSLGPDNTGKAIRRVFRPGFFKKVSRTSVVSMYGVRTLLNGTLLPAPHIGRKHAGVMRAVREAGFETGIHCNDHFRWQDYVRTMPLEKVRAEFGAARSEYERVFGTRALTAGAPGWQTCVNARQVYDEADLLYSSDTRGRAPFFPRIDGRVFNTLEIPSTLPTFDELLGRPEFPDDKIVAHYMSLLREDALNVFTLHAEIEGMMKAPLFRALLEACREAGVEFVRLDDCARELLKTRGTIPVRDIVMAEIDGRSGFVATEGE